MTEKKYLKVIAEHQADGSVRPLKVEYENCWHEIDCLFDVRTASSLQLGGHGVLYNCRIMDEQVYLFCDEGKWFLER